MKESWHERLQRWEDALTAIEIREVEELLKQAHFAGPVDGGGVARSRKISLSAGAPGAEAPAGTPVDVAGDFDVNSIATQHLNWTATRMRCLRALGEWGSLSRLA